MKSEEWSGKTLTATGMHADGCIGIEIQDLSADLKNQVVLFNLSDKKAFYSMSPEEARKAIEFVKRRRSGKTVDEEIHERQYLIQLYEKGLIPSAKLLEAVGIDEASLPKQPMPPLGEVEQGYALERLEKKLDDLNERFASCFEKQKRRRKVP
jgi:hypothetical protein